MGVSWYCVFFFNDTATTEIYTLSLHDALPISSAGWWELYLCRQQYWPHLGAEQPERGGVQHRQPARPGPHPDRKSTRLNSSHPSISYAVFCLKKKNHKRFYAQHLREHLHSALP